MRRIIKALRGKNTKHVQASLTVEASLIMPIVLLSIMLLIKGGLQLHQMVFVSLSENESEEVRRHLPECKEYTWEERPEKVMRKLTLIEAVIEE